MLKLLYTGGLRDAEVVKLWTQAATDPGNDGVTLALLVPAILDGSAKPLVDSVVAVTPAGKRLRFAISNGQAAAGQPSIALSLTHQDRPPQPVLLPNPFAPGADLVTPYLSAHDAVMTWLDGNPAFLGFALGGFWTRNGGTELDVPCWNAPPYDADDAALTAAVLAAGYSDDAFTAMNAQIAGALATMCAGPGALLSTCILDPETFGIGVTDGALARRIVAAQAAAVAGQCPLVAMYESLIPGRPAPSIYGDLAAMTGGLCAQIHVGYESDAGTDALGLAFVENHLGDWRPGFSAKAAE